MGLQVNGTTVPWTVVTSAAIAIFWLAGLSYQVKANGDELKKQEATPERLVSLETDRDNTQEDIREIKTAINKVLDEIRKK